MRSGWETVGLNFEFRQVESKRGAVVKLAIDLGYLSAMSDECLGKWLRSRIESGLAEVEKSAPKGA